MGAVSRSVQKIAMTDIFGFFPIHRTTHIWLILGYDPTDYLLLISAFTGFFPNITDWFSYFVDIQTGTVRSSLNLFSYSASASVPNTVQQSQTFFHSYNFIRLSMYALHSRIIPSEAHRQQGPVAPRPVLLISISAVWRPSTARSQHNPVPMYHWINNNTPVRSRHLPFFIFYHTITLTSWIWAQPGASVSLYQCSPLRVVIIVYSTITRNFVYQHNTVLLRHCKHGNNSRLFSSSDTSLIVYHTITLKFFIRARCVTTASLYQWLLTGLVCITFLTITLTLWIGRRPPCLEHRTETYTDKSN